MQACLLCNQRSAIMLAWLPIGLPTKVPTRLPIGLFAIGPITFLTLLPTGVLIQVAIRVLQSHIWLYTLLPFTRTLLGCLRLWHV
jgi:hypothetical protein